MAGKESPLAGIEPTEKGTRSLERLREQFQLGELPQALHLLAGSESGINDLYMNLNRQLVEGKLALKTKQLVAVAVAAAAGSQKATELLSEIAAGGGRTRAEILDAIGVSMVCAMFNGYYRFKHQVPAGEAPVHENFKAAFNANSFMKSALTPFEIEAICVAVSSYNNCHKCVEGHLHKAKSLGMTDEQVDEVIRVTAVAGAAANVIGALAAPQLAATH